MIKILCSQNLISIGLGFKNIIDKICKNTINVSIQYYLTPLDIDNDDLYIIVHINKYENIPKKYILYQIENSTSAWFTDNYINLLKNSLCIWEYSVANIHKYEQIIDKSKIYVMPMPFFKYEKNTTTEIKYDILFYGAPNKRRTNILNELSKKYNIKYGIMFGKDLQTSIQQSKIILNLHYYNEPKLESCRLNECLQYDKLIISEKSIKEDNYNMSLYENLVVFIDNINDNLDNINILYESIDYWLLNYDEKINSIKSNILKLEEKLLFHVQKCLLVFDIVTQNNMIFDMSSDDINCLHLIETPYRIEAFKKQELVPTYKIYPAIKHNIGWKGCGLSYQNIIYNAKRCNLPNITVCEDDCMFKSDFYDKYKIIKEFLSSVKEWDIFVGCVAALPKDTIFYNITKYKDMTFFEVNKMHSMVFNIYNNSVYDIICNWDNRTTKKINQIDQYIKNKNIKNIITYPFEFRCLNVKSTLSMDNNVYLVYEKLFNNSLKLLEKKLEEFSKTIVKISKILCIKYGISEVDALDVSEIMLELIKKQNLFYHNNFDVNKYFGDPYIGKPKKLYIFTNKEQVIVIKEFCSKLTESILFEN